MTLSMFWEFSHMFGM